MDFAMGFCFGFAACAFISAACFYVYRLDLQKWLTTPSDDVQVFDNGDGTTTAVVTVQ